MIFYLEDDEQIRNLTIYTLSQVGRETIGFSRAQDMYEALKTQIPDLFLLDVMLPGEDGMSVLQQIRSMPLTSDIPVMMLTAKSTEFDKVTGLDMGADDYLTKPFGMMELVSRVNALLRRASRSKRPNLGGEGEGEDPQDPQSLHQTQASQAAQQLGARLSSAGATSPSAEAVPSPPGATSSSSASSAESNKEHSILKVGAIHMDIARYLVLVNDKEVRLTRKEFEMLRHLMENRGIVVSRGQLLDHVWGYSVAGQTRTVDAHVQTLRRKLEEVYPGSSSQIETVRGVGYRIRE